ncbi:UDP-N-acetylmuramoyl-tripeptide--D-alanyl-D-alanine ligase [Moraxella cuniculi DSM 21768]|uniref:UDP-N-acetylmuramoyl-tripeptide--D-alanyl-D-alanine ligase n=1 Tax=Moraxella cuniculi DSM 21768 TaxID=1122245 RepID=A0A1N7DQ79_9GAMM|nr:Mur ligase family protein [Moraxella cuniculi]OOS05987.1 UDP-N-acetylmuramoyl-tripeptide--D-alanyl-D-alanine ligase [Moraxella cuniculi]SIR77949.1 UDP-N-acetylmuramoyl-tripeptide--D-alanyl-D-alanine ligase [Moraxella cuniculi DSM 21768]
MSKQTAYVWHKDNLQQATAGRWHQPPVDIRATRIITDTRQIIAGDVFLAICGERFDAHDFVATAKQNGAVAAIVEREVECDIPQLVVADSRLALGHLGKFRRDQHTDLTVVALTGSSGKTTTKEMLGSILGQIAPTLITRGNLNNDLGVPMMLLELTDEHRFLVVELGANHVGEIAYTAGLVRPDVAMVLNIGTAHLGEFGGRENIAKAKAEIYSALTEQGVAVLPFADEFYEELSAAAKQFTQRTISFGERSVPLKTANLAKADYEMLSLQGVETVQMMGDVFADEVEALTTHSCFDLVLNPDIDTLQSLPVRLPFIGEHNVANAQAAAAAAVALGIDLPTIVQGLTNATPPKGRLTRVAFGNHSLLDDTYNANPTSMLTAASVLEAEQGIKILVMGDIFELGDASVDEHTKLGEKIATLAIDHVLTVGTHMAHTTQAINRHKMIAKHYADKPNLLIDLQNLLKAGQATVLFKGSRGMAMESLIADLTAC